MATVPTLEPALPSPRAPRSPSPPKRSRSSSPAKRAALEVLEKPVYINKLPPQVPADVEQIYRQIRLANQKEGVIPHEVREEVEALEEGYTRPHNFRQEPTSGAGEMYGQLLDILDQAATAEEQEYHESSWNHCVHTPLLKLVFPTRTRQTGPSRGRRTTPAGAPAPAPILPAPEQAIARLAPVMCAQIFNDYVPSMYGKSSSMFANPLATEVAAMSDAVSVAFSAGTQRSAGTAKTDARGDGKKVDYVLCLDTVKGTALQKVLYAFAYDQGREQWVVPHVNHTVYNPLQLSPIAVSIGTKVETTAQDPMFQLGIWVAGWHKRMLAHHTFLRKKGLWRDGQSEQIPSTLLIEVVNHKWQLYFAFDRGSHIDLVGGFEIGSTESMLDLYVLVDVLQNIKKWIETSFCDSIAAFFDHERMAYLVEKGGR